MSGSGRQLGAVNLAEAWDSVTLDKSLSDAKSSVPPHPRPGGESRRDDPGGPERRLAGRWCHCAGRLWQVDAPRRVGPDGGPSGGVGVAGPLRRRTHSPPCVTGVGVCPSLSRPRGPGRRHGRPWCVDVGSRRAAAGLRATCEPGSVRAHSRRSPRATLTDLPRRARRGHLGDSPGVPTGRCESFRATAPATVARLR